MNHTHIDNALPDNARVLLAPGLWMEGDALSQLASVARHPNCASAVGMPDLHPGPGIPIGAAFAFQDVVRPLLVGGDGGCGVRLMIAARARHRGPALERRIRALTDGPALPDADADALLCAVWAEGPRGLIGLPGVPGDLEALAALEPEEEAPWAGLKSGILPEGGDFGRALGTIGGGNHFLEASRVGAIVDRPRAEALGLRRGHVAVLAHSGSRGLGRAIGARWGDATLEGEAIGAYLRDLAGAVRFARANRLILCWLMLRALGISRAELILGSLEVVHNAVVPAPGGRWIHRKGAAPAEADTPTVVLGSRGTPSWVMVGTGDDACLCSVAHGAGRRMGRGEAIGKLKGRYKRAELRKTAVGSTVVCDEGDLLYAEHPDAFKDIDRVVEALRLGGAADPVASLIPLITVKR